MKVIVAIAFSLFSLLVNAQDTLRVMQYNLLKYGGTSGFCLLECKREHLRDIVDEIEPALITVNELSPGQFYIDDILGHVLNVNGADWWQAGSNLNSMQSNIVNNVFYDSRLVGLLEESYVQGEYRDIRFFKFYHKSENIDTTQDTLFFQVGVAHLKAGSDEENVDIRSQEATTVVDEVAGDDIQYRIFNGDLNLYSSSESAYITLAGEAGPYADPLDEPGEWHNNANFSYLHTQSSRQAPETDDGAPGGLDDRFDFILTSPPVLSAAAAFAYVPESYHTFGNNGNMLNQSAYANNDISPGLQESLYKASDHFPVVAEFLLNSGLVGRNRPQNPLAFRLWPNPVTNGCIRLRFDQQAAGQVLVLRDIAGRLVWKGHTDNSRRLQVIDLPRLKAGIYMLSALRSNRPLFTRRLVVD